MGPRTERLYQNSYPHSITLGSILSAEDAAEQAGDKVVDTAAEVGEEALNTGNRLSFEGLVAAIAVATDQLLANGTAAVGGGIGGAFAVVADRCRGA